MSSPVVETVRTIPLVIEKGIPTDYELNTGYPFDRESDRSDRDGSLRSQLDDIAKRHPEIAEHLESFGQRDRQRPFSTSEGEGSSRRFPRQFSDRFERFGFPFERDDFDPEYYSQHFHHPNQDFDQPQTHQHPTHQKPQYENVPTQASYSPTSPNSSPVFEADKCNLQQSNTCDLGQQQEPLNDRGQRSMSAPPTEKSPSNQSQQTENMSQSNSETKSSNERIIPIHIEGRDEPVLPKNVPPSFTQQHHAAAQPDKIFGKPTEHFTQFLPHDRDPRFANNWHQGFAPEEPIRQQKFQPQQSSRRSQEYAAPNTQKGEIPIPVQRDTPTRQDQNQQQRSSSPALPPEHQNATPPAKPLTPIEHIQLIQKDVSALMEQVDAFSGKTKDKQYLYLDEMLTRNLIKLDNIDTQGQDAIRTARKEAIKCIEKAIGILEAKASGSSEALKMEVDEKTTGEKPEMTPIEPEIQENESMETESASNNANDKELQEENKSETLENAKEAQKMEVGQPSDNKEELKEIPPQPAPAPSEETTNNDNVAEKNDGVLSEKPDKAVNDLQQENSNNLDKQDVKVENSEEQTTNVESTTVKDDNVENQSESKNEKKDKKKGKKKVEKKEK